jgi:hypothetical protein
MKVYRVKLFDGIEDVGGTKILDIDTSVITSGSAETFADLTGNHTVQISRYTAGKKSVAVVSPVWLFGTDDFMEVADNALLDFGASDSFTVLAVVRQWATPLSFGRYVSHYDNISTVGYGLRTASTSLVAQPLVRDGTNQLSPTTSSITAGAVSVTGFVLDRNAETLYPFIDGLLGAGVDSSGLGSPSVNVPLRIGRIATASNYQDFELIGVAVFRRALASAEISSLTTFYQNRLS